VSALYPRSLEETRALLANASNTSPQERLAKIVTELRRRNGQRTFYRLFPDSTVEADGMVYYARDLYPRHLEWFEASATYRESCFLAANRVGKTVSGAYAVACHLTGRYPDWWTGKRFDTPVRIWAAGKTNETTRDIVQSTLLGEIKPGKRKGVTGTGIVPGEEIDLGGITWKQGVTDLIDTIKVRWRDGKRFSRLGLKSYQQGRGSFEGTAQHVIWLDEEPPMNVYTECLTRTATTNGIVLCTFTPLEGMSDVTMRFLPGDHEEDQ
jgi:phage terminase large subunit-like protein